MPPAREGSSLSAERVEAIRAFYEFASLSSADRQPREASRPLSGPAPAPGAISAPVATSETAGKQNDPCRGVRNVAGRPARAHGAGRARDRNRHQRSEPAPYPRSSTQTRDRKSPAPPASHRADRRARRDVRPDRLHRRASPLERPGRGASIAAQRPRASSGAMHIMVYAPYGRAGIYMMQDYCRLLGIGVGDDELSSLGRRFKRCPSTIRSPAS